MENRLLRKVTEYSVRKKDLEDLDASVAAAIVVSCYAVSELNVLSRLFMLSSHEIIDEQYVDMLSITQRHVVLRMLSAKTFEFFEFFELNGPHNKGASNELIDYFQKFNPKFEALKNSAGYEVARDIRNEATNHYRLRPAIKNLGHIDPKSDLTLYLPEGDGNGLYPAGEEIMFVSRLERAAKSAGLHDKNMAYREWGDWNLSAVSWVREVHFGLVTDFILSKHPDRLGVEKGKWIPEKMIGYASSSVMPLILQRDEVPER